MTATIQSIYRYPVKGLSPESLPRVRLEPGRTLPADRLYAIENGPSGFDPAAPAYLPKTQFLMLTVYEDAENIFKALAAGATGYLLKTTRQQDLVAGIRQIHAGGSPMSGDIARKVVRSFATEQDNSTKVEALSAREQEVLGLLAQGSLYKEIAAALHVGIPTVCTHVRHIYKKLQVHSRGQVAAKYFGARPDQRPPSA